MAHICLVGRVWIKTTDFLKEPKCPILSPNDLPLVLFAFLLCAEDVSTPHPQQLQSDSTLYDNIVNGCLPTPNHAGPSENRQ